jgi:glycosyltransferase involved in cell wall biosynthesis
VPVIANSKESVTKQFALSEENLFESDSPEALAQKIDYWLSHPKKRMTRSSEYVKYAKRFSLEHTALKLEAMFESAIDAFKSK